ncbi:MAG: hypothetical protein ACTHKT_13930 [Solirubrobacterales bacterium]
MDVTGIRGTAWHRNEVAGEFVLSGGRLPAGGGRVVEDVRILFQGFVATEVSIALETIRNRKRLPEPLMVDLELEDGCRLTNCQISAYWGGPLGERWFGIDLDLDALAASSEGD